MGSGEASVLFEALPGQATPERVGGGLARLRCAERSQIEWRPFSLDQLVPEDHRVRLVWRFVEGLDLIPTGFNSDLWRCSATNEITGQS